MHLTTKQAKIKSAKDRFFKQYKSDRYESSYITAIKAKLRKLDPDTATELDIVKAMGSNSWTRIVCDECNEEVDAIVTLGEEPDYESATADICKNCLIKALEMIT